MCGLQIRSLTSSDSTNVIFSKQQLRRSKIQEAKGCSFCLKDMMSSQRNYALGVLFSWMSSQGGSYQRPQSSSPSRPWASEFLHRECNRHISQHIEILGFTKANIQSYLESTIPDDPSLLADLKKYISCYHHINSMMYIPLNSAIVVEVYRNSRKDDTLVPKTMTELYSSLVRSLLLRHLLDHPVHGKKRRWEGT